MSPEKFHLLLLASEQVQPNLMVALSLWRANRLASVAILHTDNRSRSAEPARQIQNLVQTICREPGKPAAIPCQSLLVDFTPQAVVTRTLELISKAGSGRWVLNTTGGLKSMSAGLPMLSTHPSVAHVIYREIGVGRWFRFCLKPTATLPLIPCLEPVAVAGADLACLEDGTTLDSIPLLRLIQAQFPANQDSVSFDSHSSALENGHELDLLDWARHASKARWCWQHYLKTKHVTGAPGGSGPAFEWFVAYGLRTLGVRQIVHSLEQNAGIRLQEVDLVALHGDRLAFLDLKLPGSEDERTVPPGDQIRTAAETARMMGGLGAVPVMIRPTWEGTATEDLFLLAQTHRVVLLGRKRCTRLFSELAKVMTIKEVPQELLALEDWLYHRLQAGNSILSNFASPRDTLQVSELASNPPQVSFAPPHAPHTNVPDQTLHEVANDRKCNWILADAGPIWVLRAWKYPGSAAQAPLPPLPSREQMGIIAVRNSRSSGNLTVVFEPRVEQAGSLRKIFGTWPGQINVARIGQAFLAMNPP